MMKLFTKKRTLRGVHISGEVIEFNTDVFTDLATAQKEFLENFKQYTTNDADSRDQILTFGTHIIRPSDFSSFTVA